jgi:hypothetical protein
MLQEEYTDDGSRLHRRTYDSADSACGCCISCTVANKLFFLLLFSLHRRTVLYAGFDPLFWLHHTMVDKVLWLFQNNGGQWMGASKCVPLKKKRKKKTIGHE